MSSSIMYRLKEETIFKAGSNMSLYAPKGSVVHKDKDDDNKYTVFPAWKLGEVHFALDIDQEEIDKNMELLEDARMKNDT